jgi:Domain of unknown function (DUF1990)
VRLLTTALRWPAGLLITWWAYVWRITPLHRREVPGMLDSDGPPPLPAGVSHDGIQPPESGSGAFLRRRYRVDVLDGRLDAASVIANLREDVNRVVPGGIAQFRKAADDSGPISVGAEFVVRMPGPWDGPVRVIELTPTSFRFATLDGHLEAGQIEWRAEDLDDGALRFEVESWSRPGDRLSDIAHHRLRMAKEVQLHMWTSVLENVVKLAGGRMRAGVDIHTVVVDS